MNRHWMMVSMIGAIALPAQAQRVTTQKGDPSQIVRLHTSLNHLTVIEVGEPVTAVAAGSPTFKVEWRENKVFVQPTELDIATNLFIWTGSGRLNYELEPPGTVEQMDFAIDDPAPPAKVQGNKPDDMLSARAALDLLVSGKPVQLAPSKQAKTGVQVILREVIPDGERLLIRYAICNRSEHLYTGRTPAVYALSLSKFPHSVEGAPAAQLSDKESAHLKSLGQSPVEVVSGQIHSERLEPGQETQGVIAVKLSGSTGPRVLRFYFPANEKSEVSATLVL